MAKSDQAGTQAMFHYIDHYVDDDACGWEGRRPPVRQVQCSGGRYQLECEHYVRSCRYEGNWKDAYYGHEPVLLDCCKCMREAKKRYRREDRKAERQNKRKASTEKKALAVKQRIAVKQPIWIAFFVALAAGLVVKHFDLVVKHFDLVVEHFDLMERLLTALPA